MEQLGFGPGDRALEVGCGNGSISAWLGEQSVPGGEVVALDLDLSLIEPDFLPVTVSEPAQVRTFWDWWLRWSAQQGIDYMLGRCLPEILAGLGVQEIDATAETALYNGGSDWGRYWSETIIELRDRLLAEDGPDSATIAVGSRIAVANQTAANVTVIKPQTAVDTHLREWPPFLVAPAILSPVLFVRTPTGIRRPADSPFG